MRMPPSILNFKQFVSFVRDNREVESSFALRNGLDYMHARAICWDLKEFLAAPLLPAGREKEEPEPETGV